VEGDPVNFYDPVGLARATLFVETPPITVTASAPGVPLTDIISSRRPEYSAGTFVPLALERELLREERCERSSMDPTGEELDGLLAQDIDPLERAEIDELTTPPDDLKGNERPVVPYAIAALTAGRWVVYMAQTPTGQRYIGITTDFLRRQAQHAQSGKKLQDFVQLTLPKLNYATAKGVEQFLIGAAKNMNVNLANSINSVSPNSAHCLDFFRRGMSALQCHGGARTQAFEYMRNGPQ